MKETMVSKKIIKAEEMDPKFKYIMKKHGAERLMRCFQCGTCTADCQITQYSSFYHPRRIARMIQLGLKDRLLSDDHLWLCAACYTCVDHCPQDVEPAKVIGVLKEMIVTEQKRMQQELAQVQPTITEVFKLKYLDALDAKKAIEPLISARGRITVLETTGKVGWEFGDEALGKREVAERERQSLTKILFYVTIVIGVRERACLQVLHAHFFCMPKLRVRSKRKREKEAVHSPHYKL